jgi:hypothetical protein
MLFTTNAEALVAAQVWLEEHPSCAAVDVLLGKTELFRVGRPTVVDPG